MQYRMCPHVFQDHFLPLCQFDSVYYLAYQEGGLHWRARTTDHIGIGKQLSLSPWFFFLSLYKSAVNWYKFIDPVVRSIQPFHKQQHFVRHQSVLGKHRGGRDLQADPGRPRGVYSGRDLIWRPDSGLRSNQDLLLQGTLCSTSCHTKVRL